MSQKIIFFLSIFFYATIILAMSTPLTQQEITVYNAIKKEYPNIHNNWIHNNYEYDSYEYNNYEYSEIANILKANNITVEDFNNILIKQVGLLYSQRDSLHHSSLSLTKSTIDTNITKLTGLSALGSTTKKAELNKIIFIVIPLAIGAPLLILGLAIGAIQQFMPSQTKAEMSSNFITTGGILSTPGILFGLAKIFVNAEQSLKSIIYDQKIKQLNKLLDEILNEIDLCSRIERVLRDRYPNLL